MTRFISQELIEDENKSSVSYVIKIEKFRKTCSKVTAGEAICSMKFFINWSEFSVDLYVGYEVDDQDHLGVFVTNHSDWMVRARSSVTAGNPICSMRKFSREKVLKSRTGKMSERSVGWYECVPLSRCTTKDLLTKDGTLQIKVKVELLAENFPGGRGHNDVQLELELSEVKTQLSVIKAQLRQVEAKVGGSGQVDIEEKQKPVAGDSSPVKVKCPVCMRNIVKPMRLRQCPQGHIICDDCFIHLNITASESNKELCVNCKSQYCGRPVVLEELLDLMESSLVID